MFKSNQWAAEGVAERALGWHLWLYQRTLRLLEGRRAQEPRGWEDTLKEAKRPSQFCG